MSQPEYIVIVCRAWMNESGFGFNYSWDLRRFSVRSVAIKHGFETGCDDFNIGTLRGKALVAFGWMTRDFEGGDEADLSEIAQPLGLTIGASS